MRIRLPFAGSLSLHITSHVPIACQYSDDPEISIYLVDPLALQIGKREGGITQPERGRDGGSREQTNTIDPTGTFLVLCLVAGYAGLSSLQLGAYVNDKVLHVATFFVLTAVFYWVVDTTRRRALHLTLAVCALAGAVGSEFLQAAIPDNGRDFDPADIAANLLGCLPALALCAWYHRRMLDRRRLARGARYTAVPGDDDLGEDLELGEGIGAGSVGQEEGVAAAAAPRAPTLEDEVDNWDENALDDWDEDEDGKDDDNVIEGVAKSNGNDSGPSTAADTKKRVD